MLDTKKEGTHRGMRDMPLRRETKLMWSRTKGDWAMGRYLERGQRTRMMMQSVSNDKARGQPEQLVLMVSPKMRR